MTGPARSSALLLDLLAFAAGLGMAWVLGWQAKDLVWSLWLSSLVVGYTTIVLGIGRTVFAPPQGAGQRRTLPGLIGSLIFGTFLLGFFTVHFGGFHFVHSIFLNLFFPIAELKGDPTAVLYSEVVRRYWPFLAAAFLAERAALQGAWNAAIDSQKAGIQVIATAPYRNVVRMHLLIFFFAFAGIAGLESFWVYAVVFAVYFFPWRTLLRRPGSTVPSATP